MRMLWKIAAIDPETIIRDRSVTFTSDAGTEVPPPRPVTEILEQDERLMKSVQEYRKGR